MVEQYIAGKFDLQDKRAALIDTLTFENLGLVDTNVFSVNMWTPLQRLMVGLVQIPSSFAMLTFC